MAATALGTFPILLFGSDEQKKKYLPPIAAGEKLAAFGLTEANAGSDALGMKTSAVKDGDHYVLNGTKQWITNGENAEIYTILAKTSPARGARGISAFILEKGMAGFSFGKHEEKMGIRASSTTELVFQDCKVPAENPEEALKRFPEDMPVVVFSDAGTRGSVCSSARPSRRFRRSSTCWPTWQHRSKPHAHFCTQRPRPSIPAKSASPRSRP
jgi:hypothetical protein